MDLLKNHYHATALGVLYFAGLVYLYISLYHMIAIMGDPHAMSFLIVFPFLISLFFFVPLLKKSVKILRADKVYASPFEKYLTKLGLWIVIIDLMAIPLVFVWMFFLTYY